MKTRIVSTIALIASFGISWFAQGQSETPENIKQWARSGIKDEQQALRVADFDNYLINFRQQYCEGQKINFPKLKGANCQQFFAFHGTGSPLEIQLIVNLTLNKVAAFDWLHDMDTEFWRDSLADDQKVLATGIWGNKTNLKPDELLAHLISSSMIEAIRAAIYKNFPEERPHAGDKGLPTVQ